jgi:hypothetical protein
MIGVCQEGLDLVLILCDVAAVPKQLNSFSRICRHSFGRDHIMKRLTLLMVLIMISVSALVAQPAFRKGDNLISAGLGIGLAGAYGTSTLPPIFGMYEKAIHPNVSVGGLVSFSGSSFEFIGGKWKYSYIVVAGRGAYHYLIPDTKNLDTYGGVSLGYTIVSSSVEGIKSEHFSASGSYVFFGIFLGGRYYFTPKWSAMAELGYDVGIIKAGVTYRF